MDRTMLRISHVLGAAVCVAVPLALVDAGQRPALPLPEGADSARAAFPIPANVRVLRDIPYAQYGDRRLRLDLYLPPTPGKAIPGIIVIRGGGWRFGDKEGFGFIAGFLASRGFAAASIEYRASDEAKFPAAVYDTKAAVRWVRANAETYGIDPNRLGALGASAGAHLAALLGTSGGRPEFEGNGGTASVSSSIQAVVAMACPSDFEHFGGPELEDFIGRRAEHAAVYKAASPVTYVSRTSAPILLLHSETDPGVPFEQSAILEKRYRAVGASATLVRVDAPNTHDFWNHTKYFTNAMDQTVEFFRRTLNVIG